MTVDGGAFRQVMSRFAKCVTVTTTAGGDGPVGCTTTAVLSLSANPPTLLISLSSSGRTLSALLSSGVFAVNVLSRKQFELVRQFATGDPHQRFDGVPHEMCAGVPVLAGTSAAVVCRTREVVPVLDHVLLIGTVVQTWATAEAPLVLLDAQPCTAVSD